MDNPIENTWLIDQKKAVLKIEGLLQDNARLSLILIDKEMSFKGRFFELFYRYLDTEGCSCCEDTDGHNAAETAIAEFLGNVEKYSDGSGWDWKQALSGGEVENE